MKITLLCSDANHPINTHLKNWAQHNCDHQIDLVRSKSDLRGGDILFLVSCSEIVSSADRKGYETTLVLHASDLPLGRGWSPHIWSIINGAEQITVSLLEAEDRVDSGRIWKKITVTVPTHCLWDEINELIFSAEIELINSATKEFTQIAPQEQDRDTEPTYYRRRTPDDSRLDPHKSIAEQFDLIRVCDPYRYPAFFELRGHRYKLLLEKQDG